MSDIIHIIQEIPDPALRQLARAIRTNALTQEAARHHLALWRDSVPFDSGDRLTIETLFDAAENLPE